MGWFSRCLSSRALSRAFSDCTGGPLPHHVARCPRCLAEWDALARLQRAARVEVPPLGSEAVDRIRSALLAHALTAQSRTPRPWPLVAVALAGAAAVILFLGLARRPPQGAGAAPEPVSRSMPPPAAPPSRGLVRAIGDAVFSRARGAPDEVVRLRRGRIRVEVQRLSPG